MAKFWGRKKMVIRSTMSTLAKEKSMCEDRAAKLRTKCHLTDPTKYKCMSDPIRRRSDVSEPDIETFEAGQSPRVVKKPAEEPPPLESAPVKTKNFKQSVGVVLSRLKQASATKSNKTYTAFEDVVEAEVFRNSYKLPEKQQTVETPRHDEEGTSVASTTTSVATIAGETLYFSSRRNAIVQEDETIATKQLKFFVLQYKLLQYNFL